MPTSPVPLARPFGNLPRRRVEQQSRRANSIASHDYRSGPLPLDLAILVVVDDAVRESVAAKRDLLDAAPRLQLRAAGDGLGPVGHVRAGLGLPVAADVARATVVARRAPVVSLGQNRAIRRPPVPAQPVETAGYRLSRLAEGDRLRLPLGLVRIARVARHTGDAADSVVLVEVWLQVRIGHREIVGHAVQRLHPEVRRAEPREVGAPVDGAPAHGIVHQRRDGRVVVVDRVILREAPHVGVGAHVRETGQLPVVPATGIVVRLDPSALLQADDVESGPGEMPGEGSPRRARPYDHNVGYVVPAAQSCHLRAGLRPGTIVPERPCGGHHGRDRGPVSVQRRWDSGRERMSALASHSSRPSPARETFAHLQVPPHNLDGWGDGLPPGSLTRIPAGDGFPPSRE